MYDLNLRANVEYRLYAVSYDDFGMESIPSNDLLLTLPAVSALKIAPQPDGSSCSVVRPRRNNRASALYVVALTCNLADAIVFWDRPDGTFRGAGQLRPSGDGQILPCGSP